VGDRYSFHVEDAQPMQLDMRPMIEEIVRDLAGGASVGLISARFHNTVAAAIVEVCQRIRHQENMTRICLSGGVFQNMYLLKHTVRDLDKNGFQVFLHALVPPNDGGISLGQAAIANAILRREQA
jgi:hydrogenase maturation protein HypF